MNGRTREATQELEGWKSPAVLEAVYNGTPSEEVLPEMRAAASNACAILDFTASVEYLDSEVFPGGDEFLGPDQGSRVRVRFRSSAHWQNFCYLRSSRPFGRTFGR